jgi:ABC-2 type transport system ATP-binding protein
LRIFGKSFADDRTGLLSRIGYLPEGAPAYEDMRVCEYLSFRAGLKNVEGTRVTELLELLDLGERRRSLVGQLSRGLRQRVGLADALLADPPLLLLDEPTTALDAVQVDDFREFLSAQAGARTIVVSSHAIADLAPVLPRIVIMVGGQVIGDGDADALRSQGGLDAEEPLDKVVLALTRQAGGAA